MNQRIRYRGLSAKEILLRRELATNNPIQIPDQDLVNLQQKSRNSANKKHNDNLPPPPSHQFSVGDRVFIRKDKSKLRGREEYLIDKYLKRKINLGPQYINLRKV